MRVIYEDEYYDVFAIYFVDGRNRRLMLATNKYRWSFLPLAVEEVKIIDYRLDGEFVFFKDGIYYRPLMEEDSLLSRIENDDTNSYEKFMEILKKDKNKYNEYLTTGNIPSTYSTGVVLYEEGDDYWIQCPKCSNATKVYKNVTEFVCSDEYCEEGIINPKAKIYE